MIIERFVNNPFGENGYVVSEGREAIVIDCGAYFPEEEQRLVQHIENQGLTLRAHLLTHGHLDHAFGARFLWEKWGVKTYVHHDDFALLKGIKQQAEMFGIGLLREGLEDAQIETFNGDNFASLGVLEGLNIRVIETPGHTEGGVCYLIDNQAITGDTLFAGSIGRTDLPGGDYGTLMESLRRLGMTLGKQGGEMLIYPGHGGRTTLENELRYNPYLQ